MDHLSTTPVTARYIWTWTGRDPILAKVRNLIQQGWTQGLEDNSLHPYYNRKIELSVQDGCLLWGSRIVVPPQGCELVMKLLQDSHSGISRLKSLAQSYVWWPGMDADLGDKVWRCEEYQQNQKTPAHFHK